MAKQTYKCLGCEGCASCNGDSADVLLGQKPPEVKEKSSIASHGDMEELQLREESPKCTCSDPGDCDCDDWHDPSSSLEQRQKG